MKSVKRKVLEAVIEYNQGPVIKQLAAIMLPRGFRPSASVLIQESLRLEVLR